MLGAGGQVPAAAFESGEGGAEPYGGGHVRILQQGANRCERGSRQVLRLIAQLRGVFGPGAGASCAKCRSGLQPFVNGAAMHSDFRGGGGNGAPLDEGGNHVELDRRQF